MIKQILLLSAVASLCMGVSCQVSFDDDDDGNGGGSHYVQLDRATATITITATTNSDSATVLASIRADGADVRLKNGQAVRVNGQALTGPNMDGDYSRSLPKASTYGVVVIEPTLGANESTINAPGDFAITAPAAGASVSLANGFTLTWSNPDPNLSYTVRLSQLLGTEREVILGPFADGSGSQVISVGDLQEFRHGEGLQIQIQLTRRAELTAVAGFAADSTARAELSQTINVTPAP